MRRDEYATMFRAEERHWWYIALRAMLDFAWDRFIPSGPIQLLDVGCGTGANMNHLRAKATCYGMDISVDAVQCCRDRGIGRTAVASADRLPIADDAFNVVLMCDVLYHRAIRDKSVPLREAYRALKPGGLLIVNVPAYQWLYSSHDVHVHTDRRFTRSEILTLLTDAHFRVVYCTYWNALLFPPIAAVRLWRKLRPLPASDLDAPTVGISNCVLRAIMRVERAMIRIAPMPLGLSILVAAVK